MTAASLKDAVHELRHANGLLSQTRREVQALLLELRPERPETKDRVARALGALASGLAHELNNVMAVIQGHTTLLLNHPKLQSELGASLAEISRASERVADLARKLQWFGPERVLQTVPVDLNRFLQENLPGVRRRLGGAIACKTKLADRLPLIDADPEMLELALFELAAFAKHLMPRGGVWRIETGRPPAGESAAARNLVRWSVIHSGAEWDAALADSLFIPYFTTHELKQGSGFGLASVDAAVRQHGGQIHIRSRPRRGAAFDIFLPAAPAKRPPC